MATNRRTVALPRAAVWDALADGSCYAQWVVGTSHIRGVDVTWPAPSSRLHYTVGRGPLRHEGHTEVLTADAGRRLELEAHAWPLGTVRIELTLEDAGDGCLVTMVEHPHRGAAAAVHNPLGDAVLKLRNVETLRRLERVVRRRAAR